MTIKVSKIVAIGGIIGATVGIAIIGDNLDLAMVACGIITGGAILAASRKIGYYLDKNLTERFRKAIADSLAVVIICTFALLVCAIVGKLVIRGIEGIKNLYSRYKSSVQPQVQI
ncbi:hypothetical protein [Lyticum sinuosum]|uniref:Uncharacterized protein n=1 Tax=Lyticum sinuosum TaxID=1332059 RepID=A0AAE4VMG2_9RICK|nr:hypothetical protein [Lyticum sinuosum]MDZ5761608.1 hypothetical protein [Lyticum sinuosum]